MFSLLSVSALVSLIPDHVPTQNRQKYEFGWSDLRFELVNINLTDLLVTDELDDDALSDGGEEELSPEQQGALSMNSE